MSRDLPTRPNLDHLRKQAKDLLHDLQQRDPAVKLADAQHALAREYGFRSWPKLKSHVESESLARPAAAAAGVVGATPRDNGDATVMQVHDGPPALEAGSAACSDQSNPFAGRWTANVSKSRRHPDNQFQRATLEVDVLDDTVTIIDVVVDDSGREDHGTNTIHVDGKEHPSEHGNGYVLTARWRGSRVLETVAKKMGRSWAGACTRSRPTERP